MMATTSVVVVVVVEVVVVITSPAAAGPGPGEDQAPDDRDNSPEVLRGCHTGGFFWWAVGRVGPRGVRGHPFASW